MPGIRSFIALPIQAVAQLAIAEIQTKLKAPHADVKWESQDKFHITFAFLGNVEQSNLEFLSTTLVKSVQQFQTFTITFDSLGAFPNVRNPRVFWIGTKSNQTVLDIQSAVERICADFGFPGEDRTFHPHITLGRVKGIHNLTRLTDVIKTITFESIETLCSEILLMKSELHPGGSIYTILKSFPFQT
jgi:RNA 2',3'-cyclic 3'-phosphodiesterase